MKEFKKTDRVDSRPSAWVVILEKLDPAGSVLKEAFDHAIQANVDVVIVMHDFSPGDDKWTGKILDIYKQQPSDILFLNQKIQHSFLKFLQNFFVSGRRELILEGNCVYRVHALKNIGYEFNNNDARFQMEVALQILMSKGTVDAADMAHHLLDIKIWSLIRELVKYRFQQIGFFCSLKYKGLLPPTDRYMDKGSIVNSTHEIVLRLIHHPARIIDMGCGPGYLAKHIRSLGSTVLGVDKLIAAPQNFDQTISLNFETEKLNENLSKYNYVLMLDLIEHLSSPEEYLVQCRHQCKGSEMPRFIFSTGNVGFIAVRILLMLGFFTYGERGILDITHKRLFTLASFRRILKETGYEIGRIHGTGVPFELIFPNYLGRFFSSLSKILARIWPSLFAYQLLVEASPHKRITMREPIKS